MYLIQVKAVLFAITSATSYYWFLGFTPFEIACGIYCQQINYAHVQLQVHLESVWRVWQRVHNQEVRGVSIPAVQEYKRSKPHFLAD